MQPGELVIARLSKGASVVRYLGETASQVTVALGRNRQARIPHDRVLLTTGIIPSAQEEVEEFGRQCQTLSSKIGLREVWQVVNDETAPVSLENLAELCWDTPVDAVHLAALAIHLDQSSDCFVREKSGYTPRTPAAVEETQTRRRREAESAEAADSLMRSLSQGSLPETLTGTQAAHLEHLRGYAIHGEEYARSSLVRGLLQPVAGATKDLQRLCFKLLVEAGIFAPDEPLELHRAGIQDRLPENVLAEAASSDPAEALSDPARRDLTAMPAVTIDDIETRDRDDALSLEAVDAGPNSPASGYRIGIHIAHAAAIIPHGGAIDREADRRMATLYLPEGEIGMLPPDFMRRAGSLDPGEIRAALSLLVEVSTSGDVLGWEVTPSIIRAQAALAYQEADEALADQNSPWHDLLSRLDQVARTWRRVRESAGAIQLEQAEMAIKVRPSGQVEVRVLQRSTPARQLVTELMIMCNSLLAEFCRREGLPAAYRAQAAPDLSDLAIDLEGRAKIPEGPLRQYLIMRRLRPADLDVMPAPHGGLGVRAYIQATSPLRRYPDLVMQRQIGYFLSSGKPFYPTETVASVLQRAEVQLKELARLEEQRRHYWFLKYLQQSRLDRPESSDSPRLFPATVLENEPRRTALLELADYPFRVRAEVSRACAPGDTVTLRLEGVDLWRRVGKFVQARDAQ